MLPSADCDQREGYWTQTHIKLTLEYLPLDQRQMTMVSESALKTSYQGAEKFANIWNSEHRQSAYSLIAKGLSLWADTLLHNTYQTL